MTDVYSQQPPETQIALLRQELHQMRSEVQSLRAENSQRLAQQDSKLEKISSRNLYLLASTVTLTLALLLNVLAGQFSGGT